MANENDSKAPSSFDSNWGRASCEVQPGGFRLIHELVATGRDGRQLTQCLVTAIENDDVELLNLSIRRRCEGGTFLKCKVRGISSEQASDMVKLLSEQDGVEQARVEHVILTSRTLE